MSEKVESVARALCARHSDNETDADQWVIDLDNHPVRYWTNWKEDARAAIEAMREPTIEMADAPNIHANLIPQTSPPMWARAWQIMIDAALKD
jgi:hypothetical protein